MEMCKTLLGFAHFHRHGWHELKSTKPDRSFATKTGHFHLLLTAGCRTVSVANDMSGVCSK
jgi:hypothetical protein